METYSVPACRNITVITTLDKKGAESDLGTCLVLAAPPEGLIDMLSGLPLDNAELIVGVEVTDARPVFVCSASVRYRARFQTMPDRGSLVANVSVVTWRCSRYHTFRVFVYNRFQEHKDVVGLLTDELCSRIPIPTGVINFSKREYQERARRLFSEHTHQEPDFPLFKTNDIPVILGAHDVQANVFLAARDFVSVPLLFLVEVNPPTTQAIEKAMPLAPKSLCAWACTLKTTLSDIPMTYSEFRESFPLIKPVKKDMLQLLDVFKSHAAKLDPDEFWQFVRTREQTARQVPLKWLSFMDSGALVTLENCLAVLPVDRCYTRGRRRSRSPSRDWSRRRSRSRSLSPILVK